jgi:hypothetical protein
MADDTLVKNKFFVEECDLYSFHLDHEIIGWFDNFEEAKQLADQKAKDAHSFQVYRVYEPKTDANIFELNANCVYEIKGDIT